MEEILRNIRTDLRLSMNGITAASMRAKGVGYRMNFGVEIPRLKQIANKYLPDKILAEYMWREDVRELKILATMLCPLDFFTIEDANKWVKMISNQEIREQLCKNLLQQLPFADELVSLWIDNEDASIRTTGYWLFARLCILKSEILGRIKINEFLSKANADLKNESLLLRQSALNALRFFGRLSHQNAIDVLDIVATFQFSTKPQEKEIYDSLAFEFAVDLE